MLWALLGATVHEQTGFAFCSWLVKDLLPLLPPPPACLLQSIALLHYPFASARLHNCKASHMMFVFVCVCLCAPDVFTHVCIHLDILSFAIRVLCWGNLDGKAAFVEDGVSLV